MKPGSIYTLPKYLDITIVGVATHVDAEYVRGTEFFCSPITGAVISIHTDNYRKRSEVVEMVMKPRIELVEPAIAVDNVQQVVSLDELRALWPNPKTAAEEMESRSDDQEGLEA